MRRLSLIQLAKFSRFCAGAQVFPGIDISISDFFSCCCCSSSSSQHATFVWENRNQTPVHVEVLPVSGSVEWSPKPRRFMNRGQRGIWRISGLHVQVRFYARPVQGRCQSRKRAVGCQREKNSGFCRVCQCTVPTATAKYIRHFDATLFLG